MHAFANYHTTDPQRSSLFETYLSVVYCSRCNHRYFSFFSDTAHNAAGVITGLSSFSQTLPTKGLHGCVFDKRVNIGEPSRMT